jgi:hypothetical protein
MEREHVYKRINQERDYQDKTWSHEREQSGISDDEVSVAEWVNYMEFHLNKAKNEIYFLKTDEALAELRKVTALGVKCMEIHGCPERVVDVKSIKTIKSGCDGNCDCKK